MPHQEPPPPPPKLPPEKPPPLEECCVALYAETAVDSDEEKLPVMDPTEAVLPAAQPVKNDGVGGSVAHLDPVLLRPRAGTAEDDRPRQVGRVEILAAGEVEALLARRGGEDPLEATDTGPHVATLRRTTRACRRSED